MLPSCSWLDCEDPAARGAVYALPSGFLVQVGACFHHRLVPSPLPGWTVVTESGDPLALRDAVTEAQSPYPAGPLAALR